MRTEAGALTAYRAHWDVLAAIDFTTVEVWTKGGLVTIYLLFVIEIRTRRVQFAGSTANPDAPWMKQVARNLTDCADGFLLGSGLVLMDRDGKFSDAFRSLLEDAGAKPLNLPPRSPNLNAFIERFMRSLKSECLNRLIEPEIQVGRDAGNVQCRERISGLLKYYYREAA